MYCNLFFVDLFFLCCIELVHNILNCVLSNLAMHIIYNLIIALNYIFGVVLYCFSDVVFWGFLYCFVLVGFLCVVICFSAVSVLLFVCWLFRCLSDTLGINTNADWAFPCCTKLQALAACNTSSFHVYYRYSTLYVLS